MVHYCFKAVTGRKRRENFVRFSTCEISYSQANLPWTSSIDALVGSAKALAISMLHSLCVVTHPNLACGVRPETGISEAWPIGGKYKPKEHSAARRRLSPTN